MIFMIYDSMILFLWFLTLITMSDENNTNIIISLILC